MTHTYSLCVLKLVPIGTMSTTGNLGNQLLTMINLANHIRDETIFNKIAIESSKLQMSGGHGSHRLIDIPTLFDIFVIFSCQIFHHSIGAEVLVALKKLSEQ